MRTYYAQVAISVSDDIDPKDVFDYVEAAVRSWGDLRLIDDAPNESRQTIYPPPRSFTNAASEN